MKISSASMLAMLSADFSMKQANIHRSVVSEMEGKAGVLKAEIKQDSGKGSAEKKEQELAEIQEKADLANDAQMSALSDVNNAVKEAKKAEDKAEKPNNEIHNKQDIDKTNMADDNKNKIRSDNSNDVESSDEASEKISYKSIDIRI